MEQLKSLKDRLPGRSSSSSSSSTTPSSSSSSSSITGLGLRGKAGKATSYVTSKASSIKGGSSSSDSNVSVRPIASLRDPASFAPPPKRNVSIRGAPRPATTSGESYEDEDYGSGTVRRGTYPSSGPTGRSYDTLEEGDEEEYDQHRYYDQRGPVPPPPPPLMPRPRMRSDTAPAVIAGTSNLEAKKPPPPPPPKRIGSNTAIATIASLARDRGDSAPPRPTITDTPPPLPPRLPPRRETISTYTPPTPSPPPLNTEFPASPSASFNSRSESASSSPTRRRPPPPPPGPRPSTGTSNFTSTPLNLSTVSLHAPPHIPPPISSSTTTADKLAALKTAHKLSTTGDPTKVSLSEAKNAFIVGREIEARHGAEIREVAKGAERAGVGAGVGGGAGAGGVGGVRKWGVVETGGLLGRGSGLVR